MKAVTEQLRGRVTFTSPPPSAPAAPAVSVAPPDSAVGAAQPDSAATSFTTHIYLGDHSAQLNQIFEDACTAARTNNPEVARLSEAVARWSSWKSKFAEISKDMLNFACLFKGVSPSSEAGDVVLDEKTKLKSLASAKYQLQKLDDSMQLKVTEAILDLAMNTGNTTSVDLNRLNQSTAALSGLTGQETAQQIAAHLQSLVASDTIDGTVATKPLWNVDESKSLVGNTVARAARVDPIVSDITDEIHHYNQHSKGVLAGHRMARTALSVASLAPDLVGPVTNTILFTYITLTGGTEQEKILNELYIDKRLSSRANLLGEQAHLAFYNYQLGALTGNKLLMACSRQILARMTDAQTAANLLQSPPMKMEETAVSSATDGASPN